MEAVLALLLMALGAWRIVRFLRDVRRGPDLGILPRVDEEFRSLRVESELPELCFDGSTAQIVDERQEGAINEGTGVFNLERVQRFARNAHGEYFFFISEGAGKPFFKHVSQVNAKAALGKKYVAPPSVEA